MSTTMIEEHIAMEFTLNIPGLSFRRFRGEADFPHMLEIIEGCKDADGAERSDTLKESSLAQARSGEIADRSEHADVQRDGFY